jgi:hypothetical protein
VNTRLVRTEKIICPSCRTIQEAERREADGWPYFSVLVHDCTTCGYSIGESEWERAAPGGRET